MPGLPRLSHVRDDDFRPAYLLEAAHPGRSYAVIMDPPYSDAPILTRVMRQFARIGLGVICGMILFAIGGALI